MRINNRIIYKLVLILILLSSVNTYSSPAEIPSFRDSVKVLPIDKYTNKYDDHYRKYTKQYFGVFPDVEWKWFKAQTLAESGFKETILSPVGAQGLMQIMPRTFAEISKKTDIPNQPFNAKWNIAGGIFYDSTLYKNWKSKRTTHDRLALMFGSYNAGLGNLLKSQKVCAASGASDCETWAAVKRNASKVNTWKSDETKGYVTRIFSYMGFSGF